MTKSPYSTMVYVVSVIGKRPILSASVIIAACYCSFRALKAASQMLIKKTFAHLDQRPEHYEDGVVYLHTFPRRLTRQSLSLSPYGAKLESWLRLHKIPHKVVETLQFSKKTGQIPYIILDGEEIADSNKIIQFLERKFNIPVEEGISVEHQAISHCILRMVDESLSWTYFALRYMHYDEFYGKYYQLPLSTFMQNMIYKDMKKRISNRMISHGMGRKTVPEIAKIARSDIQAISKYLGTKKFVLGDSITKVDCAVFAHFSQFVYVTLPYPHKDAVKECPNILPYMDRVKRDLWPDWDQLVNMELFHK